MGRAFIQEQFSTSSSLEGQHMVPVIHTLGTHSKNEAQMCPVMIQTKHCIRCTKHMTGVKCSDYPISLYGDTAE